jgi:FdhD protein
VNVNPTTDRADAVSAAAAGLRKSSVSVPVQVIGLRGNSAKSDRVIGEEPLEIRIEGTSNVEGTQAAVTVGVTMRTPGHDFELAVGFLRSEGLLVPGDVKKVAYCVRPIGVEQQYNIVTVEVRGPVPDGANRRLQTMSASCGICGTATLDALELDLPEVAPTNARITEKVLLALPDRMRAEQKLFALTGGVHGASLATFDGDLLVTREDVGRHNAVDKTLGWAALAHHDLATPSVLVVSGRTSFEIVQKAAMSGVAVIAGVSAPSSLAINAADRFGVTLVGFVRDGSANVYSHQGRIG